MLISEKIKKSKEEIKYSQRLNLSSLIFEFINELESKNDDSYLQTVPVNIVASNESFFKETISTLIDFDEKFLIKSKSLLKRNNQKIEIEDILDLTKSTYTLGDLIAYSLKYSVFENIFKNISDISGLDFFQEIEFLEKRINEDFELDIEWNEKISINKNRIFKNLKEVYEIRNIICHDILSSKHKLVLNSTKMREYLVDTFIFQEIINIHLETIYSSKGAGLFKNEEEYYKFLIEEKLTVLNELHLKLESKLLSKEQVNNLKTSIIEFEKYIDNDSRNMGNAFFTYKVEDVLFPELILEHKLRLINQRIDNIKMDIKLSS